MASKSKEDKAKESLSLLDLKTQAQLFQSKAGGADAYKAVSKSWKAALHALLESDTNIENNKQILEIILLLFHIEKELKIEDALASLTITAYMQQYAQHVNTLHQSLSQGIPDNLTDPKAQASVSRILEFFNQLQAIEKQLAELDFTPTRAYKSALKKLHHSKKGFDNIHKKFKIIMRQQDLVGLFSNYLENKLPDSPLNKRVPEGPRMQRSGSEIFPNTYPPYPGDPEASVSISETVQRLSGNQQSSLFKLFCAAQLESDFKSAFPWAIAPGELAEIDPDKVEKRFNLLGTETPLKPTLQIQVLQLVLIYTELLGKAAGENGSGVIAHYDFIKFLTQALSVIAECIDQKPLDEKQLSQLATSRLEEALGITERLYLEGRHSNTAPQFVNESVTAFCRSNEALSSQLLHIKHFKPVIVPQEIPTTTQGSKIQPNR